MLGDRHPETCWRPGARTPVAARCCRRPRGFGRLCVMVTVADVRRVALSLPRTTEHLIRDRVKFRVGQLVYVAFSQDEAVMGFAFPREERQALVDSEPDRFLLPGAADLRFHWVEVRTPSLDVEEMTELVTDAWTMVVPKGVARRHLDGLGG